ncbi:MAG: FliM/FliN family flagellar motor switch protein [Gaiellaceae bacterium]
MSDDTTLRAFCEASGRAVGTVLERWTEDVDAGTIELISKDEQPLGSIDFPAVVTSAWYGDQNAGGNVLALTTRGAKRLAAAIVGAQEAEEGDDEQITELELSALDEATGQIMAGAAAAARRLLGRELATGSPETRTLDDPEAGAAICPPAPHVCVYSFSVCDEPAHLIQIVPSGFLAQASKVIAESQDTTDARANETDAVEGSSEGAIRGVPVRVWAELGRLRMPLARAVGLPPGVVVEFECGAEDPIELFVNGRRFATGRLLIGEGRWAVEIETVFEIAEAAA